MKSAGKPKSKRLILKILKWSILWFFVSSIATVILFRFINPPATPLMMIRAVEAIANGKQARVEQTWVPFSNISNNMKNAAIAAEDNNFMSHFGIDFKAIEKAQKLNKKGKKLRGASTITQQTAKNVFLWPSRTWVRKGFELYFSGLIEIFWSKQRILEVYLNIIEMGDGIYGIEAASQKYFNKPASALTASESAYIAAVFPNPIKWQPNKPTPYINRKKDLILRIMGQIEKPQW